MGKTIKRKRKKVGRNEPCPCGSGKKYKKCCINKKEFSDLYTFEEKTKNNSDVNDSLEEIVGQLPNDKFTHQYTSNLKDEFRDYKSMELITTLAGLEIYPENHSHIVRLDEALKVGCSFSELKGKEISNSQFEKTINDCLPADGYLGRQEDPVENLFTNNIIFHGGNYIVFPGITDGGSFILKNILNTIFDYNKELFPQEFVEVIWDSALAILTLSDEVAKRAGYSRYLDSPNEWGKDIEVPKEERFNQLKESVKFTREKIESLFENFNINFSALEPFIIRVGDDSFSKENPLKNPLFSSPFVEIDDKIILASPVSILVALRHFIFVLAKEYNILDLFASKYNEVVWDGIKENLKLMSFKRQPLIRLPTIEEEIPIKEGVYKFDSDKIAYVQLITDDATNYDIEDPYGMGELSEKVIKTINDRIEEVINKLSDSFYSNEIFLIIIIGGIGRIISFDIKVPFDEIKHLSMSAENLDIITQLQECDNLTLWKYAESKEKLYKEAEGEPFSPIINFLDRFSLYLDHEHSFYITDDKTPNFVNILPGYGIQLRIKASKINDEHAVLKGTPSHYITVRKRYKDDIPIYYPKGAIGISLEQLVKGYSQPLWIDAKPNINDISTELKNVYFQLIEMLSYWLWQLIPSLSSYLKKLHANPINVLVNLQNHNKWVSKLEDDFDKKEKNLDFGWKINNRTIVFNISSKIQSFLARKDNYGERLILDELLKSFNDMLKSYGYHNALNSKVRSSILDNHIPIGMKKKIFILNSEKSISLNSNHLPILRRLQKHDIQFELDNIVEKLDDKIVSNKRLVNKKQKNKLCNNVVDIYYQRLKKFIAKFSWKELLNKLMANNEAIWNFRSDLQLTTPTRIECFSDIEIERENLKSEIKNTNSSALANRILIEIIVADPPKGSKKVSTTDLDKMLAIVYHLINWAMLSDYINLELFDVEFSILESNRIGVELSDINNFWEDFWDAKTTEGILASMSNFQEQFEVDDNLDNKKINLNDYNSVFKAEFGLTFSQITEFYRGLISIGKKQKKSVASLQLSDLTKKLENKLEWSSDKINKSIELFSLTSREKWEKPPEGFSEEDIWPWHYNRRLSYLRKPIILLYNNKNDTFITFWGIRHVEESYRYLKKVILTGRNKGFQSSEMEALMSQIQSYKGKEFTNKVKKWFENNFQKRSNQIIDAEIEIGPGEEFEFKNDIGDIDVLVIDKDTKSIFLIECKNINYGRNPRELANEIDKFDDEGKAWVKKHLRRDKWVKDNIEYVCFYYNLDWSTVNINSFFITSEEIPTPYIKDLELPFISFSKLKHEGLESIF
ncbi:YecA family protein [Halanaerobaculum tunisiense]